MAGNHFMQWDYQGKDGRPEYLDTSGESSSLIVPDSPGYPQIIGDRTSLPGSPHHPMAPRSPGLARTSDPQDPYGHVAYKHHVDEEGWRREDLVRLAQAKVVLLGSVAAGKTSLLNTLRYGESGLVEDGPEGRTIGIEVHSVALKPDTKLWFYDFGGHDTYHFSQQLFLSQRAIYLLAVDISIYDPVAFEKTLQHWYTILTSRLVMPVICLLATHIDLCHDKEVLSRHCQDMQDKLIHMENTHRRNLENELQILKREIMSDNSDDVESIRKFQPRTLRQPMQRLNLLLTNRPKVFHSVCCISSKTLEGISQFRENLVSIVTENESLFPQKDVPGSWIELSDAIVSKKDSAPFVTIGEFIDLAQQFSIVGDHVQKVLAYLQSVGLVLHYQDYRQNSDLSKYVFVNPNLLLAIFGLVFNHNYFMDETRFVWKHQSILRLPPFDFLHLRKNLKERGIIGERLLKCFWDAMGISDEVYHAIVPLLEKFDLCYEIRIKPGDAAVEGRHFLFPYLLNRKKPPEVNFIWSEDLLDNFMQCGVELIFSQPSLPFGFLEKVLIRAHTYVDHCLSWKQGMVAFCDEGQDLVRIETKTNSQGNAYVTLSARVRLDRKSMARHIILLLVAVTNRVLLHHYPGIVAYWYCQCAHCLVKSLEQKYSEVKVDHFPADNIVYSSPGDMTQIRCVNCAPGEALHLDDIFPRETDDIHSLKRLMSEPCCRALKSSTLALIEFMSYRDVMNALLRKKLLNIKQAEIIGSKSSHEERAQQLLIFMTQSDQKAFEVLCDELMQSDETAWLAEELRVKSAGRNSKAIRSRDSDSISSSPLRGASAGWRGSMGSQGSGADTSISNWSTYSMTSYGATGSYIRRPYGSYITREPVQNYKRSSSTSSTPQQQRKEPATLTLNRTAAPLIANTALMSKQADHIRKPAQESITEQKNSTKYDKKRLSHIIEFSQEDLTNHVARPYRRDPIDTVPTAGCEVEIATTAIVQTSGPQIYGTERSRDTSDVHHEWIAQQSNDESDIFPQTGQSNNVQSQGQSRPLDDEIDLDLQIESKQLKEPPVCDLTQISTRKGNPSMDYTQSTQYETDIDADIILDYRESNEIHHQHEYQKEAVPEVKKESEPTIQPQPKKQQHQHQQQRQLAEPELKREAEAESEEQQKQVSQPQSQYFLNEHSEQQPEQHLPQLFPPAPQPQHAEQQPDQEHKQEEHTPLQHKIPTEYQPAQQLQAQLQEQQEHKHQSHKKRHHNKKHRPAKQGTQQHQLHDEHPSQQLPSQDLQKPEESQLQPQQSQQPPQQLQQLEQESTSTIPDNGEKLDPASIIYKETDLDGPQDQPQMPHDLRVRSTDDILGQIRREPSQYPPADVHGSMPSQGRVSEHLVNGRGRPKSRSVLGLIGSADLGPTHVLQDMEPIELPLKPMKRSRSSSLNKSLRRPKSKSPQQVNQEDLPNTWAVPYDWEQHNSMESLHRSCPSRKSGGFVFAASALDVRCSNRRPTSSPPLSYSSQPLLNTAENRCSMPRPTGKKVGTLPHHEYIEPIPLPEEFIVSQSAPVHRRQRPFPAQGIPLAQKPIYGKPGSMRAQSPNVGGDRPPVMNLQHQKPMFETRSKMGSVKQNLQGQILPSHPQVQQVRQSEMSRQPRLLDGSEATESFHTGRSRIESHESDDATITSDISELTIESFHTTCSHNPSITSRAISHGSHISDRTTDSYHTAQSYANSDILDDVTITSDVSELTIDSFHTFNNSMTPTSICNTSTNTADLTMVSQISDMSLSSAKSGRLSDDEVTLTSDGSNSPVPFAIDDTPNKSPMRTPTAIPASQPLSHQEANDMPGGTPSGPHGNRQPQYPFIPQSEEKAPPVPPRKDLMNQAPPIPARPANVPPAMPQQRPRVTFADDSYGKEEMKVGTSGNHVKEAKTVLLPRTDPQWSQGAASAPEAERKKGKKNKKKKKEKISKKTLLPYVGTTPEHDKAVRIQRDNGHPNQGHQQQPQRNLGAEFGLGTNIDNHLLNNNNMLMPEMQKDFDQNYVKSTGSQQGSGRIAPPGNQQVYTVHAQAHPQVSMLVDPRLGQHPQQVQGPYDHSKPHAYVQPYMRGANAPGGQWVDNLNSNNGSQAATDDFQGGAYPYKGGNGNGIVLVEDAYVSSRGVNANAAPYQQQPTLQQQSLRYPPHGGATGLGQNSRGSGASIGPIPRMGMQSQGRPGDRNSTASSQDTLLCMPGSHDTAV